MVHYQSPSLPFDSDNTPAESTMSMKKMCMQAYWRKHEDPCIWSVMECAIHGFHFLMLTWDIFGNQTVMHKHADVAFETAFKDSGIEHFKVTPAMVNMLVKSISSFHSKFKEFAQVHVPILYNFATLETPEEISAVVQAALFEENFSFCTHDITEVLGLIQGLYATLVSSKSYTCTSPPGRKLKSKQPLPMPPKVIAFPLTVSYNTPLRFRMCWRWQTGLCVDIDLFANKYHPHYQGHLEWIKAWGKKHPNEWSKISAELGTLVVTAP
ncbi:hypothetical protein BS47DRAFT_1386526 [Hydnum rufescens UP504]|uniref:DUF6532 domain-containing protein n=1 Tax=Hydnum rufescens UP504 TaxID=1448309 RepID=A0A9P6ACW5_9AGAM|nr:hypothetical protein BS47DRAFT_1386526 [Hydnum rufescens UP504]